MATAFAIPTCRGSRYRLEAAGIGLQIDAGVGGRIVELSFAGRNLLLPSSGHAQNYGSTLWTSPQSQWGWPPPPQIDADPYRASIDGEWLVLEGEPSPALGIAVTKSFRMGGDGNATIRYRLTNRGTEPVSVAPWEVTRVERKGLTFFPLGARIYDVPGFAPLPFSRAGEVVFIDHGTRFTDNRKLYADSGKGWLAHAGEGFVFVKRFERAPGGSRAPGEAEIEIYVNADPPYVELEQQGPFSVIAPGSETLWSVDWQVLRLPAGVRPVLGEQTLVDFVESV